MEIKELLNAIDKGAGLSITVSPKDLNSFGVTIAQETCREVEAKLIAMGDLQCVTPKQVCELLQVNLSTLFRWKRDGYLTPIKVGCSPRYRMRDIQQLLEKKEDEE